MSDPDSKPCRSRLHVKEPSLYGVIPLWAHPGKAGKLYWLEEPSKFARVYRYRPWLGTNRLLGQDLNRPISNFGPCCFEACCLLLTKTQSKLTSTDKRAKFLA